jgi:Protein of unknown function (DUF3040)
MRHGITAAALCDATYTHPSSTEALNEVLATIVRPTSHASPARDPWRGSHFHDGAGAGPAPVGDQLVSLDHHDFLQLSRIAESVRRSDPELARKLAAPMGRPRSPWKIISYVTLSVSVILLAAGLAIGDATSAALGGVALLTIYPILLISEKKRFNGRNARWNRDRQGT